MLKNVSALTFAALLTATAAPPGLSNSLVDIRTAEIPDSIGLTTPKPVADKKPPVKLSYIDIDRNGARVVKRLTVFPLAGRVTAMSPYGREFQIQPMPPTTVLNGETVLARSPLSWYGKGPAIIYRPNNKTNVIPAPLERKDGEFKYSVQKQLLEKQGYKVHGQFGRQFHDGKNVLRYFKVNEGKKDPKIGQSAPNILLSGVIGLKDGSVEYIDFSHEKGSGHTSQNRLEDVKQNKIIPALKVLEERKDVVYMTIDTHALITKPEDIRAVAVRGDGKRGGPFLQHQLGTYARCVRVFNLKTNKLIAVMITPSQRMVDTLTLSKHYFGNNIGIQFLDGDEPAAAYFEQKPNLPVKDEMTYNNHRVIQMLGQQLIVEKR